MEGNYYFLFELLYCEYLIESLIMLICLWKGLVYYYNVVVDGFYGLVNLDVVWYYCWFSLLVCWIKNYVVFWYGVMVEGEFESWYGLVCWVVVWFGK